MYIQHQQIGWKENETPREYLGHGPNEKLFNTKPKEDEIQKILIGSSLGFSKLHNFEQKTLHITTQFFLFLPKLGFIFAPKLLMI